jgi:sensor histidine kinase YesM
MARKIIDPKFSIKTFTVKSANQISPLAKTILQSFKLKLYYYVVEDLFYFLKSNPFERNYLLEILDSTVIFLHNNLYVNFFDIYIYEITISELPKINRFIEKKSKNLNYITIKLAYQVKPVSKKLETNW